MHKYSRHSDWNSDWLTILDRHPAMPDLLVAVTASEERIQERKLARDGEQHEVGFYSGGIRRLECLMDDFATRATVQPELQTLFINNEMVGDIERCANLVLKRIERLQEFFAVSAT